MIVHGPETQVPTPPPAAVVLGTALVRIGAGVGGLFVLLVLAARSEGDDHAAAVFLVISVLGIAGLLVGLLLDTFGSIRWAASLRRSGIDRDLPELLTHELIAAARGTKPSEMPGADAPRTQRRGGRRR